MFEVATVSRQGPRRARLVTVGLSIGAHVLAAATVVALSFEYASDSLPEPPDILAFVAEDGTASSASSSPSASVEGGGAT